MEKKKQLIRMAKNLCIDKQIDFIDATYKEVEIGSIFLKADLLVSPGNVGLNAVHALSYGTPVITHNNVNNQMPEHETIIENFNGCSIKKMILIV